MKEKCTKPSCDYWHPPECVKHLTNEVWKFGENSAFLHSDVGEAPNKISKKDSKSDKRLLQFYAVHRELGCVSQDIELTEQTVGPTNARGSILKNNDKRCPRAHLDLKYTKTAERLTNIGEQVGPCLEVLQGGTPHHPSSNAPTFADRDPNWTLWDVRKAA